MKNADLGLSDGRGAERDDGEDWRETVVKSPRKAEMKAKVFEIEQRDAEFDEKLRNQIKGFLEMVTTNKDGTRENDVGNHVEWQKDQQHRPRIDS